MTQNALERALADSHRSYLSAKASISQVTDEVLARSSSGIPFGNASSMTNAKQQLEAFRSWVFAAIRPICNRIAAQPIHVGKVLSGRSIRTKTVDEIENHPIVHLLENPNDLQTGWGLVWATVASINLTGRAFWWVPDSEPSQLFLIPVSWVQGSTGTTRFQSWKVRPPGHAEPIEIPSERMVYFSLPSPADPWGSISPLQTVAEAINNDHDILRSQRSAFGRGLNPLHAIVVGKTANGVRPRLTAKQQRQIVTAIQKRYANTDRHGEAFIIDGLIEDIKRLTDKPSEMDWNESAKAMKERILLAFGTSPYVIGSSEPGSRAASAMAEKHFLANVVNPLIACMSGSMTEWLGPIFSTGERLKIWIEPASADDDEMQLRRVELAAKHGVVSAEELRDFAGLPQDESWDNVLVGGRNLSTTHLIESGLREMVMDAMGGMQADSILSQVSTPSANGNASVRRL